MEKNPPLGERSFEYRRQFGFIVHHHKAGTAFDTAERRVEITDI